MIERGSIQLNTMQKNMMEQLSDLLNGLRNNKGQLGNLQGIIMTLVVVGILIGAAYFILGSFLDQAQAVTTGQGNLSATQGINKTINAFDTVPNLLPLVVLISMIVIILALVFTIPGARSGA